METRILIIKVSALGDIVHALPVLSYLKTVNPDLRIDWVAEEPFAPLLRNHPLIDSVVTLKTKAWRRQPFSRSTLGMVKDLIRMGRSAQYEVALDLQGNSKSGIVTLLSRAGRRYGFHKYNLREWPNLLATNRKVLLPSGTHHITDRSLAIAEAAFPGGVRPTSPGPLSVETQSRRHVERLWTNRGLAGKKVAVFHCGTSWPTKCWHLDYWTDLVGLVSDRMQIQVLMTWGNEAERAVCEEIHRLTNGAALVWPKSELLEIVALLEKVTLVVGGDTGLIHMAAALGTPTVSLYFVTDSTRNGPRGEMHRLLQSPLECSPCRKRECNRVESCTKSIPVEDVFQAIQDAIHSLPG